MKTYQKPVVKVVELELEDEICNSLSGGSTTPGNWGNTSV